MLTCKGQFCGIMIERINLFVQSPSFWAMAYTAAQLKLLSVGMLRLLPEKEKQTANYYK